MARKRDNGEGAVYPVTRWKTRKDGTRYEVKGYRGYVTLGVKVVGGRTVQDRKYVSASSKAECVKKVRDLQNQQDAGTLTLTASPSVREWLTYYLDVLAPRKPIKGQQGNRASTIALYKNFAKNWIFPHLGTKKLEKLKVEHLEALYQAMADAGLSTSAIRQVHSILRSSLEVATSRGRMARNIAALAMLPAGKEAKDVREVSLEEARAVLTTALSRPQAARWVMRLAYALRTGEILGLSWDDIDFDANLVRIRRQLQRQTAEHGCGEPVGVQTYSYRGGPEKTRPAYPCGEAQAARCPQGTGGGLVLVPVKTRTSQAPLPLPAPVAEILRKRRSEQKRDRIQAGERWKPWTVGGVAADLVFTSDTGRPVDPRRDYDDWADLLEAAGVEWTNPHASRHWGATILVGLGVHPRTAMDMLRHADVSTTLNLYAKAPSADLRAAADAMAAALLGKAASE